MTEKRDEIEVQIRQYPQADDGYHLVVSQVINAARRAKEIFESSELMEKRAFLNFLLQNCTLSGKKLAFTVRKPFNHIVDFANCPTVLPGA